MNLACKKIIQLLFVFLPFAFSPQAFAQTASCQSLFATSQPFLKHLAVFKNEVRNSRGGVLFVKNPTTKPNSKYLGFFTEDSSLREINKGAYWAPYVLFDFIPHMFGALITMDLNYRLTIFKPFDNAIDSTTRLISRHIPKYRKEKELRLWVKLPLVIGMAIWGTNMFDSRVTVPQAFQNVEYGIYQDVTARKDFFDNLIQNDFKFHDIKKNVELGTYAMPIAETEFSQNTAVEKNLQMPEVRPRVFARELLGDLTAYYKIVDQIPHIELLSAEKEQEIFGNDIEMEHLFHGIQFFIQNGVQQYDGTIVKKIGPLNDSQVQKLYNITHILYLKYRLIESILASDQTFDDLKNQLGKNSLLEKIFSDNYTQTLETLKAKKVITREQLIYFLEEDAYYQYNFQMFNILGITNLKVGPNGYTNQPLTLNDIRQARLDQVTSTSSSIR